MDLLEMAFAGEVLAGGEESADRVGAPSVVSGS